MSRSSTDDLAEDFSKGEAKGRGGMVAGKVIAFLGPHLTLLCFINGGTVTPTAYLFWALQISYPYRSALEMLFAVTVDGWRFRNCI